MEINKGYFTIGDNALSFLEWIDMRIQEEIDNENYEEVIKLKKDKEDYEKNVIRVI